MTRKRKTEARKQRRLKELERVSKLTNKEESESTGGVGRNTSWSMSGGPVTNGYVKK